MLLTRPGGDHWKRNPKKFLTLFEPPKFPIFKLEYLNCLKAFVERRKQNCRYAYDFKPSGRRIQEVLIIIRTYIRKEEKIVVFQTYDYR